MMDTTNLVINKAPGPSATTFTMSEQKAFDRNPATGAPNGVSKPQKPPKKPDKSQEEVVPSETSNGRMTGTTISGAELKKQKAAEKAARRADRVAEKGVQPIQAQQPEAAQTTKPDLQRRLSVGKQDVLHHKRTGSSLGKQLPLRPTPPAAGEVRPKPRDEKRVPLFSHLYTRERRTTIAGTAKDVHPAVLALGLQIRDYVICGGSARCVAMLLVFKRVIHSYNTPPGMALSRHLTQHLSHQIAFLSRSRPLSISQGNSIRWLKKLISALDPDRPDTEAKDYLSEEIDRFIREKITLADELIQKEASVLISNGDVILTYAKSSIVEKSLLAAKRQGKKFQVIVVDSRPLFEGRHLARSLATKDIEVEYVLLTSLADVVARVTKCFLGASAMMGNGRLYSRAGTAIVAMMAKDIGNVPTIVLCESVKFTSRVSLDSITMNELGEADSLVEFEQMGTLILDAPSLVVPAKGAKKNKDEDFLEERPRKGLEGWKDQQNLHLLDLMYDVTPTEYLDIVITEMGGMPPSSVPVVNGIQGDEE